MLVPYATIEQNLRFVVFKKNHTVPLLQLMPGNPNGSNHPMWAGSDLFTVGPLDPKIVPKRPVKRPIIRSQKYRICKKHLISYFNKWMDRIWFPTKSLVWSICSNRKPILAKIPKSYVSGPFPGLHPHGSPKCWKFQFKNTPPPGSRLQLPDCPHLEYSFAGYPLQINRVYCINWWWSVNDIKRATKVD